MRDEKELRRPGFTDGPKVILGDGREWTFPRPWLRLYPVRSADGSLTVGGGTCYGASFDDLVDQLVDGDPSDTTFRLTIQFRMAAELLCRNYDLDDRHLRRLLAIDVGDPTCAERWASINQILLGRAPKHSADGSATP